MTFRFGFEGVFQWPNKRRIPWLLVAFGLMFASAYSIARLLAAMAMIGAWTGLRQYEARLSQIQAKAIWWESLAIGLPFFAALMLGFGKGSSVASVGRQPASLTYPAESQAEKWTAPFVRYFVRLAISVLGTFGFLLVLLLIGFVFYKLRIHVG